MDYRNGIQISIDYIETNLQKKITVELLSEGFGVSPYHYYRIFNHYVGMPVMEYVKRRRMAHALCDLSKGRKILDIALDYGFESHTGFGRAFKKEYGCSPEKYRIHATNKLPDKVNLLDLASLKIEHGIIMPPKIIQKGPIKIIGYEFKTTLRAGKSTRDVPAFWSKCEIEGLEQHLYDTQDPVKHGEYGVSIIDMKNDELSYLIGVEGKTFESAEKEMKTLYIPKANYAVFTTPKAVDYKDFPRPIAGTWEYIFKTWFPNSGYEFDSGKPDFEFYDERCHNIDNVVMEIYIPVVKS